MAVTPSIARLRKAVLILLGGIGVLLFSHAMWLHEKTQYKRHIELIDAIKARNGCCCAVK